jgi:hypothetical protein
MTNPDIHRRDAENAELLDALSDEIIGASIAQLLTYLRLGGWSVGLLINFNVPILKSGIRRVVNGFPDSSATSASRR